MAALYANENFPLRVVEALRQLGHDVLTVREAGTDNQGISDQAILAFAVAQWRAVITINRRDFIRLHRQQPLHHGSIVCTEHTNTEAPAQRIDQAIRATGTVQGSLLRVNLSS